MSRKRSRDRAFDSKMILGDNEYKASDVRLIACPDCNAMGLASFYIIPIKRVPRWLDNKFFLRCVVCSYERPNVGFRWNKQLEDDETIPFWIPLYHWVDRERADRLIDEGKLVLTKVADPERDYSYMRHNDGRGVMYIGD